VLVSAPALLLLPDAGAAALPNIAGRLLDRVDAARTVIVVSSVPHGSGQAFALLEDRGLRIAVVADAAAGADPDDLIGWSPWALVFPLGKDRRPTGLDPLSVQQVASALARRGTHLIAEAGSQADVDALRRAGFVWISMATGVGGQVASDPALPATESAHPVADAGHPTTA
jgi:hypothetical protein